MYTISQNPITTTLADETMTAAAAEETTKPVDKRTYYAWPGLLLPAAKSGAYVRVAGKMPEQQFTPEHICEVALNALHIAPKMLTKNCRKMYMVDVRCIITWLCYKYSYATGMKKIGALIGRDRTTAIHMVDRANNLIETREKAFIQKLHIAEIQLLTQ